MWRKKSQLTSFSSKPIIMICRMLYLIRTISFCKKFYISTMLPNNNIYKWNPANLTDLWFPTRFQSKLIIQFSHFQIGLIWRQSNFPLLLPPNTFCATQLSTSWHCERILHEITGTYIQCCQNDIVICHGAEYIKFFKKLKIWR